MKCPKCSLVVSNKKDVCPRCHLDLRPKKVELGLAITQPGVATDKLIADIKTTQSFSTPETQEQPKDKSTKVSNNSLWDVLTSFSKKNHTDNKDLIYKKEPKVPVAEPVLSPKVEKNATLSETPNSTLENAPTKVSPPETKIQVTADDDDLLDFVISDMKTNVSTAVQQPVKSSHPLNSDDSDLQELMLALEELSPTGNSSEEQLFPENIPPISADLEGIIRSFEEPASSLLAGSLAADSNESVGNVSVSTAAPSVSPEVLEFDEDEENLNQKLDELLGSDVETLEIAAVKIEPTKNNDSKTSFQEDDLEISFEVEIEDGGEDLQITESTAQEPDEEKYDNEADPLLESLLSTYESFQQGTSEHNIAPKRAVYESEFTEAPSTESLQTKSIIDASEKILEAKKALEKLKSLDDAIYNEMSKLLADAYGVERSKLVDEGNIQHNKDTVSANSDAELEGLAELTNELDSEISALKTEGSSFHATEVDIDLTEELQALEESSQEFEVRPTNVNENEELEIKQIAELFAGSKKKESNSRESIADLAAAEEVESTGTGIFLASDQAEILKKDNSNDEHLSVAPDELWTKVQEELAADTETLAECDAADFSNLTQTASVNVLFDSLADELENNVESKVLSGRAPLANERKIINKSLQSALKTFERDQKRVSRERLRGISTGRLQKIVKDPVKPASPWKRLAAMSADAILLAFLALMFAQFSFLPSEIGKQILWLNVPDSIELLPYIGSYLELYAGLWIAFSTIFVAGWGQTPGDRLLRLEVVTTEAETLDIHRSLLRALCQVINCITFGVGLLTFFGKKHLAAHDIMSATVVRHKKR